MPADSGYDVALRRGVPRGKHLHAIPARNRNDWRAQANHGVATWWWGEWRILPGRVGLLTVFNLHSSLPALVST